MIAINTAAHKMLSMGVIGALLLTTACAAPPEYNKPLPTTVEGCEADYRAYEARARQVNARNNTGAGGNVWANIIGTAIGKGVTEAAYTRRYRECLASVGVDGAETAPVPARVSQRRSAATRAPAAAQPRPAACPRGFKGMYRGTLYC